ncbi:hypothetical protein XENOCAPTIV_004602, partial [Xenoophorus captivus]
PPLLQHPAATSLYQQAGCPLPEGWDESKTAQNKMFLMEKPEQDLQQTRSILDLTRLVGRSIIS